MRPDDLALLRTPGIPAVAPDGRIAVVAVHRPDLEADEYRSQLWAVPTDASAPARPLTSGGPGHAIPRSRPTAGGWPTWAPTATGRRRSTCCPPPAAPPAG